MGNRIKRLLVLNLIFLSVMYLAYLLKIATERKQEIPYETTSYLKMEYKGSEPIGGSGWTDWGEELLKESGYTWHCVELKVENQGSREHEGIAAAEISLEDGEVRGWSYEGRTLDIEDDYFAEAAAPYLPGEASVTVKLYIQARDGTQKVLAKYSPAKGDEPEELELMLDLPVNRE